MGVTFIASLAYLAMATHHGFYTRCFDGPEFYYARYLDWVITTPMMLHALAYIGNMSDNIWHYLFFNDILMIISGLIGSPVVWILAEGTGTISANGEAVFYTVLDLISKAGFGIIIVTMRRNSFAQTVAAGW